MDTNNNYQIQEDEISVVDIINVVKKYFQYLKQKWWIVASAIALVFGLLIFYYYVIFTPSFPSKLTFMTNEESGGSAISSALGGLLGGLGGSTTYNLDKILALSKSMRIINASLLTKDSIDGKVDYYANFLIDQYELHDSWKGINPALEKFYFKHDNIDKFSLLENQALKLLYMKVVGDAALGIEGLYLPVADELSGIMSLTLTTRSQLVSIGLVKAIYKNLGDFYINKTIEKERETYDLVKSRRDSILFALNRKQYSSAVFDDQSRGMLFNKDLVSGQIVKRDANVLTVMYGEAEKNLQLAKFALDDKTPYIQSIDIPFPPIRSDMPFLSKLILLSVAIGGFLSIGYLVVKKYFTDLLEQNK